MPTMPPTAPAASSAAAASEPSPYLIGYLTLRKLVGGIGVAMPFVMYFGGKGLFHTGLQSSISAYYHTGMRDVLVGILCAIGVFLFCYRGGSSKENWATNIAGACAIGIALFPTGADECLRHQGFSAHGVFAVIYFAALTYLALFVFTAIDPAKQLSREKIHRNWVYRICAVVMAIAVGCAVASFFLPEDLRAALCEREALFYLESIAGIAFGIAWLTKGKAIPLLNEKAEPPAPAAATAMP